MGAVFIVSHLDQQMGPFSEPELKAKWAKGELLPIDYVYDDAKKDWILLAERFEWARGPGEGAPPPLKPDAHKKKIPPAPPSSQASAALSKVIQHTPVVPDPAPPKVEISGQTLITEWKKSSGQQGAKVKIVDGQGEVDITTVNPGQVELALQDSSAGTLKLQEPLRVQVRALEPEEVMWSFPLQIVVGQDIEIAVKAVDGKGILCAHYNDNFLIKVAGSEPREVVVRMAAGQAVVKMSNTKSEVWKLTFHYSGTRTLRLPESKAVEWQPGPAARLILDGPPELIAGNPLKVHVKAVDQFGNLAKSFQGTVILEVKAS